MSAPFGQILDVVLASNLERQASANYTIRSALSPEAWMDEFCTVSLSYGRQTGKTTAIGKRASSNDLVITYNYAMAREFTKLMFWSPMVVTRDQLSKKSTFARKKFDRIWVDEASLFGDLDVVLEIAVGCDAKQIILVG